MNTLKELELERVNLSVISMEAKEQLRAAKLELSLSFTNEKDTLKLSKKVVELNAKQEGIELAVESNARATESENKRLTDESTSERMASKKGALKAGLEGLDSSRVIAEELSIKLQSVLSNSLLAGTGVNNELNDSVRKIIGGIISDCGIMSTSLRSVIHIQALTAEADFERLASNLRTH